MRNLVTLSMVVGLVWLLQRWQYDPRFEFPAALNEATASLQWSLAQLGKLLG